MFCTQCGHKNPAEANFCSSCGASLADQAQGDATMSIAPIESVEIEEDGDITIESVLPGTAMLVIRRGPDVGAKLELEKPVTTAGRNPDADLLLDDITVSRKHAEFVRESNQVVVRDVGSLNGTYVNQEQVDQAVLQTGDEIQIGKFKLVYVANLG